MLPPSFTALTSKGNGLFREIITDCEVSLPTSTKDFQNVVKIKTKALWDTGATNCCITKKIINSLGLKPIKIVKVCTAEKETESNVYLINLYLPNNLNIGGVEVTECFSKDDNFGVIIGMDVICLGDFSLTNIEGNTTFSFRYPSINTIDYCEEAKELKKKQYNRGRNKPCGCGSGKKYKYCHGS